MAMGMMPSSPAARMMRMAISPRLATSNLRMGFKDMGFPHQKERPASLGEGKSVGKCLLGKGPDTFTQRSGLVLASGQARKSAGGLSPPAPSRQARAYTGS